MTAPAEVLKRAARVLACLVVLMSAATGTASADPDTNPCQLVAGLLCRFLPMAPELEGDIDLTKDQPPVNPSVPEPDSRPPADICANGCS